MSQPERYDSLVLLGFTMLGPEAGEVMAVVQAATLAGMPHPGLRDAILTHPTMAEGLVFLFGQGRRGSVSPHGPTAMRGCCGVTGETGGER